MKKSLARLLLGALVAVFAFGSSAEAAPRKGHHRTKHSSRVSSSATAQSPKHQARSTKKTHKARKPAASSSSSHAARPHRQATKPR